MAHEPVCKNDPRIEELAEALKVLADPTRLRMMCFLSKGESCVCEVEQELGISQQLTSHHLHVLMDSGFLILRKQGARYYYSIDRDYLARIDETFDHYLNYRNVGCGIRADVFQEKESAAR